MVYAQSLFVPIISSVTFFTLVFFNVRVHNNYDLLEPIHGLLNSQNTSYFFLEKLREDRTPTITKEARQLDQMVKKNKVTRKEKGTVATAVKDLIRSVLFELKKDSPDLKWDKFHSGSYYDNTKVDHF